MGKKNACLAYEKVNNKNLQFPDSTNGSLTQSRVNSFMAMHWYYKERIRLFLNAVRVVCTRKLNDPFGISSLFQPMAFKSTISTFANSFIFSDYIPFIWSYASRRKSFQLCRAVLKNVGRESKKCALIAFVRIWNWTARFETFSVFGWSFFL